MPSPLLQEQNYYPFGLSIHEGESITAVPNNFKYQGKEMQGDIGLNLSDFTARNYDHQIGRFNSTDPMSQFSSEYTGMGNDPANIVDPTGCWGVNQYGPGSISSMTRTTGPAITGCFNGDTEPEHILDGSFKEKMMIWDNALNGYIDMDAFNHRVGVEDLLNNSLSRKGSIGSNIFNNIGTGYIMQWLDFSEGNRTFHSVELTNEYSTNPSSDCKTWDPVTNKRISQLDERVQGAAADFINAVEARTGVQLRITQGLRTNEEQNTMYAQGRTTPGNIVTNAQAGQSYHNFGLAIDVAIMESGKVDWTQISPNIAAIGIGFGFEWGGNWSAKRVDYPHFQMPFGLILK